MIGEPVEGKGVPLLAVCGKATVDRRMGAVLPGWPAAALARSWDYVWYLTVEQRFSDVYLPLEIDVEMTSPLVHFVYRDLDTSPVPALLEARADAFTATPEASEYHLKKSGHSTRSKAKKEKFYEMYVYQDHRRHSGHRCGRGSFLQLHPAPAGVRPRGRDR